MKSIKGRLWILWNMIIAGLMEFKDFVSVSCSLSLFFFVFHFFPMDSLSLFSLNISNAFVISKLDKQALLPFQRGNLEAEFFYCLTSLSLSLSQIETCIWLDYFLNSSFT